LAVQSLQLGNVGQERSALAAKKVNANQRAIVGRGGAYLLERSE
jgi:hypothetical protein